jgi:hypothetical protein
MTILIVWTIERPVCYFALAPTHLSPAETGADTAPLMPAVKVGRTATGCACRRPMMQAPAHPGNQTRVLARLRPRLEPAHTL